MSTAQDTVARTASGTCARAAGCCCSRRIALAPVVLSYVAYYFLPRDARVNYGVAARDAARSRRSPARC